MPVTITRNPENGGNLFFTSGQISFSELRRHFTDDQSGFGSQISASQLRRDTDVRKENPIVPDATHNEQISTGNNLSLSQFRGSVKRYLATQSGTDDNNGLSEPGFRMGLYDPNGRGLDFAGGGVNGRDGQGGNDTGNHTKNVQKGVLITGTCGSLYPGHAAAQLTPRVTVHNFRINVSGRILGYGGTGGYNPQGYPVGNASGEDGGIGLNVGSSGYNNRVRISGGFVAGGGGGGEQGLNGGRGSTGTCWQEYNVQSCGNDPGCNQGGNVVRRWSGDSCETYCVWCWGCCVRTSKWMQYATCRKEQTSTTPTQGIGGRGGNGQGYNKPRTNGENGSAGTCPTCPGGYNLSGGQCGGNGGRGGDGGDWGQDGGETPGGRTKGRAGAALQCDTVTNRRFALYGDDGPNNVKGAIINFER